MLQEAQSKIPKLYETENVPVERKIIHQRYQISDLGFYWLIAELDRKNLAFGYANLNDDQNAEWGYISIDELNQNGADLDREWKPCTFKEAMEKIKKEQEALTVDTISALATGFHVDWKECTHKDGDPRMPQNGFCPVHDKANK